MCAVRAEQKIIALNIVQVVIISLFNICEWFVRTEGAVWHVKWWSEHPTHTLNTFLIFGVNSVNIGISCLWLSSCEHAQWDALHMRSLGNCLIEFPFERQRAMCAARQITRSKLNFRMVGIYYEKPMVVHRVYNTNTDRAPERASNRVREGEREKTIRTSIDRSICENKANKFIT